MATIELLTTYWTDADGEFIEVECDGLIRDFDFTSLDDLQIDLWEAGYSKAVIPQVISDVRLARERELLSYTDDVALADEPVRPPYYQAPMYPASAAPPARSDFWLEFCRGYQIGAGVCFILVPILFAVRWWMR
jgi:hypothetical protein